MNYSFAFFSFFFFNFLFPVTLTIVAHNRLRTLLNLFDAVVLMFDRNESHIFIFISSVCVVAHTKREEEETT